MYRRTAGFLLGLALGAACAPQPHAARDADPLPGDQPQPVDDPPAPRPRDDAGSAADPVAPRPDEVFARAPQDARPPAPDAFAGDLPPPAVLPDLPGLVLLLDATTGVVTAGDKVQRWEDQSPAKNDAVMTSATLQPTLVRAAAGGLPAVHFSGKRVATNKSGDGGPYLRIKDAPTLNWGTGDWLIEVVVAYDNPLDGTHNGALGAFYGKSARNLEIFFCGNWTLTETTEQSALHIGFGEGVVGMESRRKGLNDGKVRVYGARRNKGALELRVDGELDRSTRNATTNLDMPGADVGIGSFSGGTATRSLRGDIYLLLAVKGPTEDATVKALEAYLMAHYHAAP